jgi:hypothetical protein
MSVIKVHCMYVWKYHDETPLYKYMLIKIFLLNEVGASFLDIS